MILVTTMSLKSKQLIENVITGFQWMVAVATKGQTGMRNNRNTLET